MNARALIINLIFLVACLMIAAVSHAQTVYLKPVEALKLLFQDSQEVTSEKKTLDPLTRQSLGKKLGQPLAKDTWNFYVARTGGKVDGYAVIDNEIGKVKPITFITALNPKGRVKAVEILVYREAHGGEVHEKAFTRQYQGKSADDPLKLGQDIKNITGATLSSRGVTRGVKRALLLWQEFYGK